MISKIDGLGPIRTPQQVKRTAKAGSAGSANFAKHLDESGEAGGASALDSASAVMGVIGVQEIDDALARESKGKMRASDILDKLEDLRLELLGGTISREKLVQLTRIVSARRASVTDPRLAEILDEIDLRAQVELAKHSDQPV